MDRIAPNLGRRLGGLHSHSESNAAHRHAGRSPARRLRATVYAMVERGELPHLRFGAVIRIDPVTLRLRIIAKTQAPKPL